MNGMKDAQQSDETSAECQNIKQSAVTYGTQRQQRDTHIICCHQHSERKRADTIGTVPVPWTGHFQC